MFEYSKDKSKYGVTGIALKSHPENVALTFMGISNKQSVGRHRLRLCQQTKAIDPWWARRCDWLMSTRLITVLLLTCEQPTQDVHIIWAMQPLSFLPVLLSGFRFLQSVPLVAVCRCSLLQCIFSFVCKPSEEQADCWTDVPSIHPALLL